MALIRHRRGRCQAVMGHSPFHTCMNPSCGEVQVDGVAVKLCRVHLKKHDSGKSVEWTNGTYSEATGRLVWHAAESRS